MKGKRGVHEYSLFTSDPDPDSGSPLKIRLDNTLW